MKIVYISSSQIPSRNANSIHVMKMCQAFAQNGYDILLCTPDKNKSGSEIKSIYSYYGTNECFRIRKIPWFNIPGKGYVYGFLAAMVAYKQKPDLVYCRNLAGCFFSTIRKMPVIFESHSPISNSGFISDILFKIMINKDCVRSIVFITSALKHYYQRKYFVLSKIKLLVAPDGADSINNDVLPIKLPNSNNRLQVGYIGHLYKGRGIEQMIELAKKCTWANFHIVGGKEADIEYWNRQIKNIDNLFLHGFVPPGEVKRFHISFDVLLAPYQNNVAVATDKNKSINTVCWMSPLKIFEYMASKKPIIASKLPVLEEILIHERNALLCDPENISEWKVALERIMNDGELGISLAEQAYKDFVNNYTWQKRAKKVLE